MFQIQKLKDPKDCMVKFNGICNIYLSFYILKESTVGRLAAHTVKYYSKQMF